MSHQPLRHMPPYPPHPHHSSAFHRVNHPHGHLPESHGWVIYEALFFNFNITPTCNFRSIWMTYFIHWTQSTSHFRSSSSHACPFLQQQQQQQHHHPSHNRLFHPPTNSNLCPLSMGSTVPLQHHPPHPGPPVIIDVDQMPDHVRAVPVTSLPNSLLVASVPVAAPTYIQPHHPHQVSGVYVR